MVVALSDLIRCPRCRSRLHAMPDRLVCSNRGCHYATEGFGRVSEQPILIDFERSIFNLPRPGDAPLSVLRRDDMRRSLRNRVVDFFEGHNQIAIENSRVILRALKTLSKEPTLLVIGGGARGAGIETFLQDSSVQIIATDVYPSVNTHLVADAHHLPFDDGMFDGVWITAVLEHVLEPQMVVDEIWRVLKPSGLVYAETPFMAPVHEVAYDFTRFTANGHRWLFRRFEQIDAGVGEGAGLALGWSIRYFLRTFFGSQIALLAALPFFLLRLLSFGNARCNADAAFGLYFSGRKSDHSLTPKDMVAYYESQLDWGRGRPSKSAARGPVVAR